MHLGLQRWPPVTLLGGDADGLRNAGPQLPTERQRQRRQRLKRAHPRQLAGLSGKGLHSERLPSSACNNHDHSFP
jgi:hypothetical protein